MTKDQAVEVVQRFDKLLLPHQNVKRVLRDSRGDYQVRLRPFGLEIVFTDRDHALAVTLDDLHALSAQVEVEQAEQIEGPIGGWVG